MKYRLDNEKLKEVINKVNNDSTPDNYFYTIAIASCVIATYGLLSASVAVIIAAMVVVPLM